MKMSEYALARAGNADALAALIRRHAPLVQSLAVRFQEREDAFQWGCTGLLRAIRGFREETGYQFSTYAVPIILGEMRKSVPVRFGWRTRKKLKDAREYREKTLLKNGREPTVSEMARAIGMEEAELALLLERDKAPAAETEDSTLCGIADPRGESWLMRFLLFDILDRLPGMEGWLLRQRFDLGRTQKEIGCLLHTDQSSISRTERKARNHFRSAWLEE